MRTKLKFLVEPHSNEFMTDKLTDISLSQN